MPTSTAVPVEESLRTTYDPDMEYCRWAALAHALGAREHAVTSILEQPDLVIEILSPDDWWEIWISRNSSKTSTHRPSNQGAFHLVPVL